MLAPIAQKGKGDGGDGAGGTSRCFDLTGRLCASQPRRMLSKVLSLTLPDDAERARGVEFPQRGGEDGGLEVVYLLGQLRKSPSEGTTHGVAGRSGSG